MASPRPRGQRPCDNCRRRKTRCLFSSDNATNCLLCESRSTNCTYVEEPPRKKRALATNNDDESNIKGQSASGRPRVKQKQNTDTASGITDYSQLTGPTLLKETLGHQNRQSSLVIGATADFDQALTRSLLWNTKGEAYNFRPPQVLRRPDPTTYFLMRPDAQEELDAEIQNLDTIENFVTPHGPELVKIYFRIVHPSFPILHKNVFLEKHGRSYRELTPIGLGAVYILAMNWWSYSPALSNLPKPDCKELERKVIGMLFAAHQRPKISDLQGGLVLMQSPSVGSWALTGHLVAMAQNLGINADCTNWQIPDWERGVRKRVAWALFMQDKWGAIVYGRGSHIKADDWDVQPLDDSDFPETARDNNMEEGSADIEKGKKTFLEMVSLTSIVADILDTFFTLNACRMSRTRSIQEVLELAKPLQLRLKSWYASMPAGLSVGDTVPRKLSSVGYLHLAYYTAEITLHRAILRAHDTLQALSPTAADLQLFKITRQAADLRFTSALEFVKRLKAEHFQSFWYFSSGISFTIIGIFAGILCAMHHNDNTDTVATSRIEEGYIAKLAEYRWVLRISATGAEFMKYAVGILDVESQLLEEQFGKNAVRFVRATLAQDEDRESPLESPVYTHRTDDGAGYEEQGAASADAQVLLPHFDDFLDPTSTAMTWLQRPDQQQDEFDIWNVNGYQS